MKAGASVETALVESQQAAGGLGERTSVLHNEMSDLGVPMLFSSIQRRMLMARGPGHTKAYAHGTWIPPQLGRGTAFLGPQGWLLLIQSKGAAVTLSFKGNCVEGPSRQERRQAAAADHKCRYAGLQAACKSQGTHQCQGAADAHIG